MNKLPNENGKRGDKPTLKQEAFVQAYLYGADHIRGNQSAAYREAYNAENMTEHTIWPNACRLMTNSKVAARLAEEKAKMAEQNETTVADILKELDNAAAIAEREGQAGAAVSAAMGKAKLLGFITEKVQQDTTVRSAEDAKPAQFSQALKLAKQGLTY